MFNSLKYAKKLEEVGVSREQAETHVQILSEIMETTFATKQDIHNLDQRLVHSVQMLEQKIVESEQRMTIKLGTIVSIAIGVAVTLVKVVG